VSRAQGCKALNELVQSVKQLGTLLQQRRLKVDSKPLPCPPDPAERRAEAARQLSLVAEWRAWRDMLSSIRRLAARQDAAGQHALAAQLRQQVLRVEQHLLGEQGRHAGATAVHQQRLQVQQHVLVLEDPDTMQSLRDVALSMEQLCLQQRDGACAIG
jgi:hypothetical protein